ncbi:hypothetical protein [Yoonia sp. TsM2_T14_4]|uniref:hypothetical protein n=1 Tax=Yoonia sp. TsM2_T14_4 TaxID=3415141 RepID=UPI003C766CAF
MAAMVADVFVEKADADCKTAFTRMIKHGFLNIRVVSGERNSIACSEIMKITDASLAKMTELQRRLTRPASIMTKDENQVGATDTADTICRFFSTSQ